jgi:aspartyl-tRNA(Asn)/glutamyl-tRNA(Gln) amidotransferase subunit A
LISKSELIVQPIRTIESLFLDGSFEPNDLIDLVLQNIKKNEKTIHAFIYICDEEKLRQQANEAQRLIRKGNAKALSGIPIAVKDNTNVEGMPCTGGSLLFEDAMAQNDSWAVSKLRENGAIFIGKTNLDEMAAFGVSTNNPHFGRTFNPWNLSRIPGGSSGGSAAAVVSEEAVAATGTDTGGSVRIPACLCGLAGIKPTYGRIGRSRTIGMSWSLDHFGVIARMAEDCELLTFLMSGIDHDDSSTASTPLMSPQTFDESGLTGLQIAILENPLVTSEDAVQRAFLQSARVLEKLGASITSLRLPFLPEIKTAIFAIALAETAAYHEQWLRTKGNLYGKTLKSYVELGHAILATQYLKAQRLKTMITKSVSELLRKVDALIVPTAPFVAPEFGRETIEINGEKSPTFEVLTENTYPFNFLGLPAISIPNGFKDNLATGLQIISNHWQESVVFRIAHAYQRNTDFHKRRPALLAG